MGEAFCLVVPSTPCWRPPVRRDAAGPSLSKKGFVSDLQRDLLSASGGPSREERRRILEPRRIEVTSDAPKRFGKLMKAEESWANNNSEKEKDNYQKQYR